MNSTFVVTGLALLAMPWVASADPPQATAYQITVDHAGVTTSGGALALQETPIWSVTLPGEISYPIIADGGVFVIVTDFAGGPDSSHLYALDAQTGTTRWAPVAVGNSYYGLANLTYEDGTLFTLDNDGLLRTFDAATGTPGWSVALGSGQYTSPPTASNGVLYVSAPGVLFAIDESNGGTLWVRSVINGDHSAPAVGPNGVYVSYACPNIFAFDMSGTSLWHYPDPVVCSGGGGSTPVYADGKLYARSSINEGFILDVSNGSLLGTFPGGAAPAITATSGFFLYDQTLRAVDLATSSLHWSFAGDGTLRSAPLVVDESVLVGSTSGKLYALDTVSGAVTWQVQMDSAIEGPDEHNVSQPLTGLAVANGLLVVPATDTLVAYSIFGPPAPTNLAAMSRAGAIQLDWTPAAGAVTYNVYMGPAARTENLLPVMSGVTGTTATIVDLNPGTAYFFKVKAVSPAGISAPSNESSDIPHRPGTPAQLVATAGVGNVTLTWNAASEAMSYNVYAGPSAGRESPIPLATGVTGTQTTLSGLSAQSAYFFTVKAVAHSALSEPSNEVSATPLIPPPTELSATAGIREVSLTWTASEEATSYSVYRGTSAGGESGTAVLSGLTALSATVTGLSAGTTYYFVVKADTAASTSPTSNEVSATPTGPAKSGKGGGGALDWLSLILLAATARALAGPGRQTRHMDS